LDRQESAQKNLHNIHALMAVTEERDALKAELEKLKAERDGYKQSFEAELEGNRTLALEMGDKRDNETMRTYCKRVAEERGALKAEVENLKAALFDYGHHKASCVLSEHPDKNCTCGLDALYNA
jgi:uncharacterized small protein (DUF1192 family)